MSDDERQTIREICQDDVTFIESSKDRDVLAREGGDVEIVYGNVREFELASLPKLGWVQCTWAGVENILYPVMIKQKIYLTNVRGQRGTAMSEHAIGGLLYLLRDFPQHVQNNAKNEWSSKTSCGMIADSSILLLGMGAIADIMAPRLQAFGATLYGVNSDARSHPACKQCFTLESMHEILSEIDHVICCLPATALTEKIMNADFFNCLKSGAAIVNISRGSVIDESALINAIDSAQLCGAVLDVTSPEPPVADSPMFAHPRILLTSHNSWAPRGDDERSAFPIFCHNLKCWLAGNKSEMLNVINYEKGY